MQIFLKSWAGVDAEIISLDEMSVEEKKIYFLKVFPQWKGEKAKQEKNT